MICSVSICEYNPKKICLQHSQRTEDGGDLCHKPQTISVSCLTYWDRKWDSVCVHKLVHLKNKNVSLIEILSCVCDDYVDNIFELLFVWLL